MTNLSAEYFRQYLLKIYPCRVEFSLKVTHKRCKTRLGSYNRYSHNINIHDKQLDDEYCKEVAIHEYAHHLHHTEPCLFTNDKRKSDRSHGCHFWIIYTFLMQQAYQKELFSYKYMLPLYNKLKPN